MSREANPAKARRWSDRLDRFENSGQTIAQFCIVEGVSHSSFYLSNRRFPDAPTCLLRPSAAGPLATPRPWPMALYRPSTPHSSMLVHDPGQPRQQVGPPARTGIRTSRQSAWWNQVEECCPPRG